MISLESDLTVKISAPTGMKSPPNSSRMALVDNLYDSSLLCFHLPSVFLLIFRILVHYCIASSCAFIIAPNHLSIQLSPERYALGLKVPHIDESQRAYHYDGKHQ